MNFKEVEDKLLRDIKDPLIVSVVQNVMRATWNAALEEAAKNARMKLSSTGVGEHGYSVIDKESILSLKIKKVEVWG